MTSDNSSWEIVSGRFCIFFTNYFVYSDSISQSTCWWKAA